MCLQGLMKSFNDSSRYLGNMHIQKPLRITKGNNFNRIGHWLLQLYYKYLSCIYVNIYISTASP